MQKAALELLRIRECLKTAGVLAGADNDTGAQRALQHRRRFPQQGGDVDLAGSQHL
jgi:hypothetical protein